MASKKVLSVELGVQTTRLCEIEINGKKKVITNTCVFDTPEGTVEDGYIRNKEILAVSIKAVMQKKLIVAKEVMFSLSSSKIANREVNMPFLPDNKIGDYVKTNAKDYFPIEVERYVITYKKLEEIKDAENKKLRVLVLAAPNDLIETYYSLAETMGLQITALDYSGNSSYQVLKRQNFKGVNVVVQLNEANTLINIMKGSTLLLQRTVPYGVSSVVDTAINCGEFDIIDKATAMEKLLSDTLVNPKLNESAIDDVALSYMDSNNDAYSQQIKQMKAKDMITDAFNYLVNNTIRVLDYYSNKFPEEKVDNIYLAGIGSRIKGILPLFKNEVFKEIRKIDNIVGIDYAKTAGLVNEEKSDYIVVVGTCLEPVDFVPKRYADEVKNKKTDVFANRVALGLGLVGVIFLGVYGFNYIKATTTKASLETEIKKYAAIETLLKNKKEAEVGYNNATTLFTNTMEFTYLYNVFLEEIESIIPTNLKLTNISYANGSISMSATCTSYSEAGEFIKQLKKCLLVQAVAVDAVTCDEADGKSLCEFEISVTPTTLDYSVFISKDVSPSEAAIQKLLNPEGSADAAGADAAGADAAGTTN